MCLETAQILSTAHYSTFNSPLFYSPTHNNHPVVKWLSYGMEKISNGKDESGIVTWFLSFFFYLLQEYSYRYSLQSTAEQPRYHAATLSFIEAAKSPHIRPFACNVMAGTILPEFFPVAINWELIPDSLKPLVFYNYNIKSATPYNCIILYRHYYLTIKYNLLKYTRREVPHWVRSNSVL